MTNETLCKKKNKIFKSTPGLIIVLVLLCWIFFGYNTAGNYHVVQKFPSGRLEIVQSPGLYWKGPFGKVTKFKISDVVSFVDKYEEQKKRRVKVEDAIMVTFKDNGQGTINGFMRYSLPADEEKMRQIVKIAQTESVLKKLIKANVNTALTLVAANYESGDSVKERGKFIQDIFDTLRNGLIAFEKKSINGKIVMSTPTDPNGQIKRLPSLGNTFGIGIANFTLKNIVYDNQTKTKLDEQRLLEQERNIAMLNAEKLKQETLTAKAEENKLMAETSAQEEHKKLEAKIKAEREDEVAMIKATSEKNIAEIHAAKNRKVAEIKLAQAELEKKARIVEAEGQKIAAINEAEGRSALAKADDSLELRLQMQKETLTGIANALKDMKVPHTIIGSSNKGDGGLGVGNPILDMFLINQIKQLQSFDEQTKE